MTAQDTRRPIRMAIRFARAHTRSRFHSAALALARKWVPWAGDLVNGTHSDSTGHSIAFA